ncbi:MAG: alpha/beta hydrolase [Polyangiaceae bacterium]|nr:alpha/beta hydrolase [Polyangiaceae bacterium]
MSTRRAILTDDGVTLAVQDGGRTDGRPIVFLHGIAQSSGAWRALFEGPLAKTHRLVALDMRGHGSSSAPEGAEAYASGERLGADLHEVLTELGLERPVVVAWSYGGVVLGEYLRRYTARALGGIAWVAAAVKVGKPAANLFGSGMMSNARAILSSDAAAYEEGARAFVRACTREPLLETFVEAAVADMRRVPLHVRRALLTRSEDYTPEIVASDVPMTTIHGSDDAIVLARMSEEIAALRADVESVRIEGVGHVPWMEAPEHFHAALRSLLTRVG